MIRNATDADLLSVLRGSKEDEDNECISFYCNRQIIVDCHLKSNLFVLVEEDVPVGFLANGETEPLIVAVLDSYRGLGYGKQLAHFMFDYWHRGRGHVWIDFEVAPLTALPFWKHMGCVHFDHEYRECYVFHELPETMVELPPGEPVVVELTMFEKEPVVLRPKAVRVDNTVFLDRRVLFRGGTVPIKKKIIEIKVSGKVLHKGLFNESNKCGLVMDPSCFGVYLDAIQMPFD
jgi:GNAT superfamily N-acetyltransferase